ncbi:hypothetical protein [uncultured Desulfuromonas sp.]|uniref:hypothetical protein n=1 Tax=uncultured Desulfuromonas sp. TaxID=181013 RepID=UPI002AAA96C5|nr:hypothetical protein [uncultured Desulfuromonas sp.]
MNSDQPERYTACERCGKKILEKCAIEDSGKILCGDCVVLNTDKEVQHAEKIVKQKRKEEYQLEHKRIIKKQRQRALYVFIACVAIFGCVQIFNYMNRPEPVKSIHIDLKKNRDTMRSLIVFAIHSYQTDHKGAAPDSLDKLVPNYLSEKLQPFLENFEYKKSGNATFVIEEKNK